ncbi:Ig-like domain-containing protein [Chloroflexota bacterium]
MKNQPKLLLNLKRTATLIFVFFLTACNLPAQESGGSFSAQITSPVDGAHVPVNTELEIKTQVSSPGVVTGVTLEVNGESAREDLFSNPTFQSGTVFQPWTPKATGTYALQVILQGSKGEVASNVVTVIVGDTTPTSPTLIVTPSDTPTPLTGTPTATTTTTITQTPTPDKPQATANQNANCRKGPGTAYSVVWSFKDGQTASIVGRDQYNSWMVIDRLDGNGQCWVWVDLVDVQGNINDLPVIPAPSLPPTDTPTRKPTFTPTPTQTEKPPKQPYFSCRDYPDFATCNDDPMGFGSCYWDTGLNNCQP